MALTYTPPSPYPQRWPTGPEYREWRARVLAAAAARREAWRKHHSRSTKWLVRELGMHQFHLSDDCAPCRSDNPRSLSLWYIRMIENELHRRSTPARGSLCAEYGVAMACRITELVLDCRNPEVLTDFWCQVLGFAVLHRDEDGSVEIGPAGTDPDDPGLTLVFSPSTEPKQTKLRLHFDVNAVDRSQDEELQRLRQLGARKADVGQTGEESWHVLADPEGNEFCLLRRTVKPAS